MTKRAHLFLVLAFLAGCGSSGKPRSLLPIDITAAPDVGAIASVRIFITQGADVIFQIAGLTGQGALEAACAPPNVHGIGVDVDQALSIPTVAKCLVTSAEKKLKDTVTTVVKSVADGSFKAGTVIYNAASVPPAIGLSPYHDQAALITPDIQAKIDKAFADMASGALKPPRK